MIFSSKSTIYFGWLLIPAHIPWWIQSFCVALFLAGPVEHFQIKWRQIWIVSDANFCYFKQLYFKWSGRKIMIRIMKKVMIQINFTGILSRFFTDFSWILNEFKRILPLLCNNTCVFLLTPKPCYIKICEKSVKNLLKIPVKFVLMMTFFMILIIIFLPLDLKKSCLKSQKLCTPGPWLLQISMVWKFLYSCVFSC